MKPSEMAAALALIEGIQRKPVGIKFIRKADELPSDIPEFGKDAQGSAKSMLCAMWGDAFSGAGPFYTVKKHHICGGGAVAAGFGSPVPIEAAAKFMVGEKLVFGNLPALKKAMDSTLPFEDNEFEAQVISSLEAIDDLFIPDIVLVICSPGQGQHILRAYGFDSGQVIYGIGGTSTCEMVTSYVMHTERPTFTLGDLGGNTGMSIGEHEVLLAFPYQDMVIAVSNLERICRNSTMYKHSLYHELPRTVSLK
ncbi:MAG: DUF169 domain-containing protein [Chloroherpetonaceae bacterium]|nr:DUF169 domain-containing protein [Chloroherpetonaceae bacterium]